MKITVDLDEIKLIVGKADKLLLEKDTEKELAKIGIHDPARLHPSWQQHGFEAAIYWNEPNTPNVLREFFKPTQSESQLKVTARADTHDHDQVYVPLTREGEPDYSRAEETDDFVSRFMLLIRDNDRRIEIFVKQRFEEESLAGGLPRDFFGLEVKFLELLPGDHQKLNLKNPRNFSCEPEEELTRDQALLVTQLTLFALKQNSPLQESQQEVG